ncbi:DUF438 domain-containing protein [Microaerobacter geothermalis]|uniref:DUF438 domain-containing protein n=1 Tax=Microaerobacter geothermalis TaxID=674972 RepID=UPI001F1FE504|nr:DUF438 domain-containing protein [Microaerobacter geothermalis]MCF6094643.1 DUF438 domain-containing protein [Microaerobacter geothermalis]
MSEMINNREQHIHQNSERQEKLKEIFLELYNGKNVDEVKARFDQVIGTVTVEEVAQISQLQRSILESRDLPQSEVQRLSSAHMSILKGKIEDVQHPEDEPGHPIHTFKLENREIEKLIQSRLQPHLEQFAKEDSDDNIYKLLEDINLLLDIDKHYVRKEHLIFPYLEKYSIYGPSTNMWRIDDYIRDAIKETKRKLMNYNGDKQAVIEGAAYFIQQIYDMIYREENILFPMSMNHLTEDEWIKIAHESDEIGYCLTEPAAIWMPERKELNVKAISEGYIQLGTGVLSLNQLELLLNHLPVDITFIDDQDVVRYFSQGKERIFPRTKAVIGRTVQNCHPPKSAHIVEELLNDFKSGKKDSEDFWIKFRDKYVYIRYFAVRDENKKYIGTLEFTQNIDPIQAIKGEKRILS